PSAIYYPRPLHRQPAYARAHGLAETAGLPPLPVSEALCDRVLSLPMHPYLTEAQCARVCEAVLAAL
ncbi:MAG TPA: DegT/DnrJ/EryC1/StrS family aminotransferase, partial [Crenalkalicoccus sp.]|nr:DegT/DnrJ/EryC1/StrS family aminotransferase [Crenalkalicoccus sp.]